MMEDRYYDTLSVKVKDKIYCAYCGKLIKPETHIMDRYDEYKYYHCDCDDAQKEHEIQLKEKEIISDFNKKLYQIKKDSPKQKIFFGDIVEIQDDKIIKLNHCEKIVEYGKTKC